jgi:hypothetical protein
MKKNYVKPEAEEMLLNVENDILVGTTTEPLIIDPNGGDPQPIGGKDDTP